MVSCDPACGTKKDHFAQRSDNPRSAAHRAAQDLVKLNDESLVAQSFPYVGIELPGQLKVNCFFSLINRI